MAMDDEAQLHVKILEVAQVSPPSSVAVTVPTTSSSHPLTFLDYIWLYCDPIQRLLFYDYPYTSSHFTKTTLPLLKNSLSLALHRFFLLAATLPCSPPPTIIKPYLLYTPGDYLSLTVAESSGDFNRLLDNHPDDSALLHPLLPPLEDAREKHESSDGPGFSCAIPLMAIQVTVFPNSGICIGYQYRHVACDGKSVVHFLRTWASICKNGGDLAAVVEEPPFHGREVLKFPDALELILLSHWASWSSSWQVKQKSPTPISTLPSIVHKMRATFVLSKFQINKLKKWILVQINCNNVNTLNHVSTFVAVCAFTWSCLAKAEEVKKVTTNPSMSVKNDDNMEKKFCRYLCLLVDCRNRLELEGSIVPDAYFGNALSLGFVVVERNLLIGQDGIVLAAKAIANKVEQLKKGLLEGAETWWSDWKERSESRNVITVAGSSQFRVYDTDFGWGRPRKSQVVHIDSGSAFALGDSRDEEGGLEIGISLSQPSMDAFVSIFEQGLGKFENFS